MKKIAIYITLGILAVACSQPVVYFEAKDFTMEGLFTSGIEGPAVDRSGNIYAVNFESEGTVGVVSPEGEANLFIRLPEGSTGNGIQLNSAGDMLVADYTGHNILKVDMATKDVSVFAHSLSMNQPNDIAITKDDYLYASDPCWADSTGMLWLVTPNGEIRLLEDGMGTTNGIAVSLDGKRLYVNESRQLRLWVYDINSDKTLSGKRLFHTFEGYGLDGMCCDANGNLYVTRHEKGTVVILSPEGVLLKEVSVTGSKPSNIVINNGIAYVTLQDRGCFAAFVCDPNL